MQELSGRKNYGRRWCQRRRAVQVRPGRVIANVVWRWQVFRCKGLDQSVLHRMPHGPLQRGCVSFAFGAQDCDVQGLPVRLHDKGGGRRQRDGLRGSTAWAVA